MPPEDQSLQLAHVSQHTNTLPEYLKIARTVAAIGDQSERHQLEQEDDALACYEGANPLDPDMGITNASGLDGEAFEAIPS